MRSAVPHLRVVAASVVQQSETDVVQPLDFTGVVETLKHPAANIPRTHQTTLYLSWEMEGGDTEKRGREQD